MGVAAAPHPLCLNSDQLSILLNLNSVLAALLFLSAGFVRNSEFIWLGKGFFPRKGVNPRLLE